MSEGKPTAKKGFLARWADDYRLSGRFLRARREARRLRSQQTTSQAELSAAYVDLGTKAEAAEGLAPPESARPALEKVAACRNTLREAESLAADRQTALKAAQDELARQTQHHTQIIATLEAEHKPLAEAAGQAASELTRAKRELHSVESALAKVRAGIAKLTAAGLSCDVQPPEALQATLRESQTRQAAAHERTTAARRALSQAQSLESAGSAELSAAKSAQRSALRQCQAAVASAEKLTTPERDATVRAATEKLAAETQRHAAIVAALEAKTGPLADAVAAERAKVQTDEGELAAADAALRAAQDQIKMQQLRQEETDLDGRRTQAADLVAAAQKRADETAAAEAAKTAELAQAKDQWRQAKAGGDASVKAASTAGEQAAQSVTAAQAPLTAALGAFGEALYRAGAETPAVAEPFACVRSLRDRIGQIEQRTTVLAGEMDATRPGARRAAVKTGLALLLVAAVTVGGILLVRAVGGGKDKASPQDRASSANPAPPDGPRDEAERPPVVLSTKLIDRPAADLVDPSGARAQVPAGKAAINPGLVWKPTTMPDDLAQAKVPLVGPVMMMDVLDTQTIDGRAVVDLPAGDDGKVVLVRGGLGLWIPLPAEEIKLADGRRGLRVHVDREPAPWVFAVTSDARLGETPADPLAADLIAIEQQAWADKSKPLPQVRRPAATAPADGQSKHGPGGAGGGLGLAARYEGACGLDAGASGGLGLDPFDLQPALLASYEPQTTSDAPVLLAEDGPDDEDLMCFSLAIAYQEFRSVGRLVSTNDLTFPPSDWRARYIDALKRLATLRQYPRDRQRQMRIRFPGTFGRLPAEYEELRNLRFDVALERVAADYAPWGIDLTLTLLSDPATLASFNLAVLKPMGQELFTDIEISPDRLPAVIAAAPRFKAQFARFVGDKPKLAVTLRMFSSRTVNWDWIPWLLSMTDDVLIRWGPALWGAGRYILKAMAGGGATGGTIVLAGIAWALIEQCIDMSQESPGTAADAFTQVQYQTTLVGDAAPVLKDMLVLYKGGRVTIGDWTVKATPGDLRCGAAELLFCAAVAYLQQKMDVGYLKEISSLPTGRKGYAGYNIPPVMLLVILSGQLKPPDANVDTYPVTLHQSMGWPVNYKELYSDDLSGLVGNGQRETASENYPHDLPLSPYRRNWDWPELRIGGPPAEQLIRIGLPRQVILDAIVQAGLRDAKWDEVSFEKLKLVIGVWARPNTRLVAEPVVETTLPGEAKDKDARFIAVRFHPKNVEMAAPQDDPVVPPGYRCKSVRIEAPLRCRYVAQLFVDKGPDKPAAPVCQPMTVALDDKDKRRSMLFNFAGAWPFTTTPRIEHGAHILDAGMVQPLTDRMMLRQRWDPGEYRITLTQKAANATTVAGQSAPTEESVSTWTLRLTVSGAGLTKRGLMRFEKIDLGPAAPIDPGSGMKYLMDWRFQIAFDGEVATKVTGTSPLWESLAGSESEEAREMFQAVKRLLDASFSEGMVKMLLNRSGAMLPNAVKKVGEEWPVKYSLSLAPYGQATVEAKCRLTGIQHDPVKGDIGIVVTEGTLNLGGGGGFALAGTSMKVNRASGREQGRLAFNGATGIVEWASYVAETEMEFEIEYKLPPGVELPAGAEMPSKITQAVSTKATTVVAVERLAPASQPSEPGGGGATW